MAGTYDMSIEKEMPINFAMIRLARNVAIKVESRNLVDDISVVECGRQEVDHSML